MTTLYERLANLTAEWHGAGYPSEDFPAIAEILEWAGETEDGELRFLRQPQLRALETYWHLRLEHGTPHVLELYLALFPPEDDTQAFLDALGVPPAVFADANYDMDRLLERIRDDDDFVRRHRLQALRETLTLDYPSYILALAMGAGKTILVGAIFATEFAMAQEHPEGPFVQNALVFAPGKTIIESLRELTQVPYDRILPPRMHKPFAASLRLTFTRDGDKDVPVVRGSTFNVVVTNTEKIRIRKESIRRSDIGTLFGDRRLDEAKEEVANLRLQTIASLPHLAVFSDEAHHTYGQSLESGLKKVRRTVDYLAANTNVICVVNTTGTPYYKRQPLKDVVVWYGLSQGIGDGILKELAGNIHAFDLDGSTDAYVSHVVSDFFATYRDVALPNGAPAKVAMYFPQIDDLEELRPAVDRALVDAGIDPSVVLVNTSDSGADEVEAFNRLNDPASPHRVMLLVNKGTEGWNCPSLFACALARRLKTSNNFVLQAASRCLRQVPGNDVPARVYLSMENYSILDKQLSETYGETIEDLRGARVERIRRKLVLRKPDLPPLQVRQRRRTVVRHAEPERALRLKRPAAKEAGMRRHAYTIAGFRTARRVLTEVGDALEIATEPETSDVYAVAVDLAAQYRLPTLTFSRELHRLYPDGSVPVDDLGGLAEQVEDQTRDYAIEEEDVEIALALVKPDGFTAEPGDDGGTIYTAEISYPKGKEHLLVPASRLADKNPRELGFHYDPYNFDSHPEEVFFEEVLGWVGLDGADVEDVLFTGAITDPSKTDFTVEYKDPDGKWRRYTPDFVIRRRDGRVMIVEIKGENMRGDSVNGERGSKAIALEEWVGLNPDQVSYEIVFVRSGDDRPTGLGGVRTFLGVDAQSGDGFPIRVDRARIEDFCRRWRFEELAFFGSVLREDFGPDSDVDILYRLAEGARIGWEIVDAQEELSAILGRKVDLVSRIAVEESENYIRRKHILENMKVFYVAR